MHSDRYGKDYKKEGSAGNFKYKETGNDIMFYTGATWQPFTYAHLKKKTTTQKWNYEKSSKDLKSYQTAISYVMHSIVTGKTSVWITVTIYVTSLKW